VERINFSVEVRFVILQGEDWLVELAAMIDNKGMVRYTTSEFTFELRCLYPEDPLSPGGTKNRWPDLRATYACDRFMAAGKLECHSDRARTHHVIQLRD
jgi:hypothetical protein